MKKITLFFFLSLYVSAQTLLDAHAKFFSYEQRIQHKFIQQMRFDSLHDWRWWGIFNGGMRNEFLVGSENLMSAMPQVGFDRSYALSSGKLFLGADANGSGGIFKDGGGRVLFFGYGMGGYLIWKNDLDIFASLSLKMAQVFQNAYSQWFNHIFWIGDIGGGKKFTLNEGYFFDVSLFFGMGLISATNLTYGSGNSSVRLSSPINAPFSILSVFSMGRRIQDDQVKISISPIFRAYSEGKIYEEVDHNLKLHSKNKAHFDILLSIDYDVEMSENSHFYIYADFNAFQLEVALGVGLRMEFGENEYRPLEYPETKDKKLKKTYLK